MSAVAHYKKVHSTAYHDPTPKDPVDTLLSHTKVSKKIYECLINEKASIPSRSQGKWLEERHIHCNLSIISKLGKYVLLIITVYKRVHSELLEEHVRVDLSKFQRFRKRLSLFVSLFRSH